MKAFLIVVGYILVVLFGTEFFYIMTGSSLGGDTQNLLKKLLWTQIQQFPAGGVCDDTIYAQLLQNRGTFFNSHQFGRGVFGAKQVNGMGIKCEDHRRQLSLAGMIDQSLNHLLMAPVDAIKVPDRDHSAPTGVESFCTTY